MSAIMHKHPLDEPRPCRHVFDLRHLRQLHAEHDYAAIMDALPGLLDHVAALTVELTRLEASGIAVRWPQDE